MKCLPLASRSQSKWDYQGVKVKKRVFTCSISMTSCSRAVVLDVLQPKYLKASRGTLSRQHATKY